MRNRTQYEDALDVDDRLVLDLIGACRKIAAKVGSLLPMSLRLAPAGVVIGRRAEPYFADIVVLKASLTSATSIPSLPRWKVEA